MSEKRLVYEIITDVWHLYKEYAETTIDDDEAWTAIINRGNEILEKYKDTKMQQLAHDMAIAMIKAIEREAKENSPD